MSASSAPPLRLDPGDRLRVARSGRPGHLTLGRGLHDHGTVHLPRLGDPAITVDGRELTVRTTGESWTLELLGPSGETLARHEPARRRRGTVTNADGRRVGLELPGRRREGSLTDADGTRLATLTTRNDVLLVEAHAALDPLLAAFAATVTVLRGTFKEPSPKRRSSRGRAEWRPATAGLGGFAWFAGGYAGGYDATVDFGGGGDGGAGGGDGGGGGGDGS